MKVVAIIPAAGTGTRMRASSPKQFLSLAGHPIIVHTLKKFASCSLIQQVIVPIRKPDLPQFQEVVEKGGVVTMGEACSRRHSPSGFGLRRA